MWCALIALSLTCMGCDDEPTQATPEAGSGHMSGAEGGSAGQANIAGVMAGAGSDEGGREGGTGGGDTPMGASWVAGVMAGVEGGVEAGQVAGQVAGEPAGVETHVEPQVTVNITSPVNGVSASDARISGLSAMVSVTPAELAPFVSWELTSSERGSLPVLYDATAGLVTANLSELSDQAQRLTLTARLAPSTVVSYELELTRECRLSVDFESPLNPEQWVVKGSARRDERGWLEMTNRGVQVEGGMFLIGSPINPGDVDVRFRIAAGACDELGTCPGAEISDGYAMTVWNISPDGVDDLWGLIAAGNGAAISESSLEANGLMRRPEGITVEFDTFPNFCPNNGFFDPVQEPHVEIYFDGRYYMSEDGLTREERCAITSPGDAYPGYWSATPQIVDNSWHDVHVRIFGSQVSVTLDEQVVVDTMVPNFEFKGGVLAFSGGSGAVPSFQRFDDLVIGSGCEE